MALDPAEALKVVFATNRNCSERATIAVFIGLLGDILVIFLFSKDKPKSETWLAFACALLIAVGVFGEYRFGGRASQAADQLQQISDQKVADAINDNTDLRRAMQPRRAMFLSREVLSIDEQRKLIDEFAGFSKTPLLVQTVFDSEPRTLANDILFVFGHNGWNARIVNEQHTKQSEIAIPPGVQVWTWKPSNVPPASNDQSLRAKGWRAGDFVTRYLHGAGVFMVGHFEVSSMATEKFAPFGFGPPENAVVVFIGSHNIEWDAGALKSRRSKK